MEPSMTSRSAEKAILETGQHWVLVAIPLVGYGLLTILVWVLIRSNSTTVLFCLRGGAISLGAIAIARAAIAYLTTRLTVTNKRVILRSGFLRRQNKEILLAKVESIDVHQAPICLLLGCGTVSIVGSGGTMQTVKALDHPFSVQESIHRMLELRQGAR